MSEVSTITGHTFGATVTMAVTTCWKCGMPFGIPKSIDDNLRRTHETFYCPSGHGQCYCGKSNEEKLKAALEAKQREIEYANREITRQAQRRQCVENSLRVTKGHMTRLKKRVGRGVCPCCNRHFANVENHMASQHPEYAQASADE